MEPSNEQKIKDIGAEMLVQNKVGTSWVLFIVVEDKKIYGVASDWQEGRERKESYDDPLCDNCEAMDDSNGPGHPDECDDCPDDAFVGYRTEKNVPNLRAGFFFTAKACKQHILNNSHHYDETAHCYGISAYHNGELQAVMTHLVGEENANKLQ